MNSEDSGHFLIGSMVFFNEISSSMKHFYGIRIYRASTDSKSVTVEEFDEEGYGAIVPANNGSGIIIDTCFVEKHGNGTRYYKVLFGESLLWVASAHLRKNL